jgi:Holliday junction resolvasome RuvABC endonuclease subunit
MKVMGIDPSLRNTAFAMGELEIEGGVGVITDVTQVELVKTDKTKLKGVRVNSDDFSRARILSIALDRMIKEFKPKIVFIEMPHGSQSAASMKSYGICLGVLAQIRLPIVQLRAEEVKLAAVGTKTATKREMIEWATALYPDINWIRQGKRITDGNEHSADACGALHAGVKCQQFEDIVAFLELQQAA